MGFREKIGGTRKRWLVAAAIAIVIAAFITGVYFGLSGTDRTIAQEGSTDFPYPDKVVTPITPVPTVDRTKRPLIIEYVPSSGPPVERMEVKRDAGSSTKPATGNYLYLPKIGRYYSLPDDVKEGSTDFPYPDKVVTPITPVPTVDRTKRPLIIEYVPSSGPPVERMEAKTDAGSSTKPATGNYLYLPKIGRYYSLPDDVKRVERIDLGTCIPETPCPDFPLLIYQRGEAFIGIDQVGEIFENVGNGDASAFPFFTGQEETEDK